MGRLKMLLLNEQDKTMSAEDIKKNIAFAKKTGIKEVYFWGAEWWYFRAQNGDPQILETVKAMLR
jgi:2-iminoacetate synthase ThiH